MNRSPAEAWIDVGAVADFSENELRPFSFGGRDVVVVKTSEGFFCFKDECSHQPVRLSDFGEVSGRNLLCHAHGACFDLSSAGRPLCFPAVNALECFRVRVIESRVLISF